MPARRVNHEFDRIAGEILAEARATDEAEDELYGQARGDELPEPLRTPEGRREFFRQVRKRLRNDDPDAEELSEEPETETSGEVPLELDAERIVARTQGREGWLREGKRQLEQHRWRHPRPIPRSRHADQADVQAPTTEIQSSVQHEHGPPRPRSPMTR